MFYRDGHAADPYTSSFTARLTTHLPNHMPFQVPVDASARRPKTQAPDIRTRLLPLPTSFRCIMYSFLGHCLEHATTTALSASSHGLALLLHDLADLHRGVEELGGASVEADGLALVELALAVVGGDALGLARLLQPVVSISHHAHLALDGSNLLLRGRLRTTHSEERHVGG